MFAPSMTDAITAIPDIVERFVKITRLVQDFLSVDARLKSQVDHAETTANQLVIIVHGVKQKQYEQILGDCIRKSLGDAEKAIEEATDRLNKWKEAVEFRWKKEALPESVDITVDCGSTRFRAFLRIFLRWSISRKPAKAEQLVNKKARFNLKIFHKNGAVAATAARVHFLAIGAPDLEDVMMRMNTAFRDLIQYVFLAPMYEGVVYDHRAKDFVLKARKRVDDNVTLNEVSIEDSALKSISAPKGGSELPHSLYLITKGDFNGCLLDRRNINNLIQKGLYEEARADTKHIAQVLQEEPQNEDGTGTTSLGLGLLRCCGVSFDTFDEHDLILRLPLGFDEPRTLRQLLLDPNGGRHVRAARVELAIRLCTALEIFHSMDLVHKSIRPESILILQPFSVGTPCQAAEPMTSIGIPYLAGFNSSREQSSPSGLDPYYDAIIGDLIYHHPRHVTEKRVIKYTSQDDLYSLGICLLEVGLWSSLLRLDENSVQVVDEPWEVGNDEEKFPTASKPWHIRRLVLIRMANTRLREEMGSMYADAVLTCLEFRERYEQSVAGKPKPNFITDVITKLYQINI